MKINIGSTNEVKLNAVKEAIALYPEIFGASEVQGIKVDVPELGHPKTLEETVKGAVERAKMALTDADFGIGIEGGMLAVPFTKSGYIETTICAIFDGTEIYIGMGPGFEWPEAVVKLILEGGTDASKAFKDLHLTENEKLGAQAGGINNLLTKNRLAREDAIKASFITAMVRLEQKGIYKS
jgi:inosine/xanthosine triphosphatase